jgi:copper transport protein
MRTLALVIALLGALTHSPAALGHASLIRSEPADRVTLSRSPASLTLAFNEPVSPLVLHLVESGGRTLELTNLVAEGGVLTIRLPEPLPKGTHLLSWRVISADGHPVAGALTFSIVQPSETAPLHPEIHSGGVLSAAIWITKLTLYAGLFFGVGGAFYARWIATEKLSLRANKLISAILVCGLIAVFISVGLQGIDAFGLPLSELNQPRVWADGFATSYGITASLAAVTLLLGSIALRITMGRWLAACALIGAGMTLAASGHASAAVPQLVTRSAVFLHGVTVAFWIGALLPLAAGVRAGRATELARFSRAIPAPLVVLVASGIVLTVVQVRQLRALWTTDYGLVLSAKLAAVVLLLVFAAASRWLTPRMIAGEVRASRRLVASIMAEFLIVVVILGLVASWRFTPPPRSTLAAVEQPIFVHIHADKAMADLNIEPARGGIRNISVTVLDGQFGPLSAKEVTLLLSKPEVGIEPMRLMATHVADTVWRIEGAQIPVLGRWHLRIEVLVSDFEKLMLDDDIELSR